MQFITLAIVTALVGASPIPQLSATRNGIAWTVSDNSKLLRGKLRAAQDNENGPLRNKHNSKRLRKRIQGTSTKSCYKDCGDSEEADSKYDKSYSVLSGSRYNSYKYYKSIGGDLNKKGDDLGRGSDNDSESDEEKPSGSKGGRRKESNAYKGAGGRGNSKTKAYKSGVSAGGDSRSKGGNSSSSSDSDSSSNSDSGSDSDEDKPTESKGDLSYNDKSYKGAGDKGNDRVKAYKSNTGGGKGGDSSSDSDTSSDSDSESDNDKPSGSKGGRGKEGKPYRGVGGKGNIRDNVHKSSVSTGGDSRGKGGDSSSDSDSDSGSGSDSDEDKLTNSKGGRGHNNKVYNDVDGKGGSRANAYKSNVGAVGDSRGKGGDSSNDSDSSSDSDSNSDNGDDDYSGSNGGNGYSGKAYNAVDGEGASRGKAYTSNYDTMNNSYSMHDESDSDSGSDSD